MNNTKAAFTLIELLVVVLIIGILAAVAVPQYQLAVTKSRLTQAWIGVRAIENAQQAFFLANGNYTSDLTTLDVEIPGEVTAKNCSTNDTKTKTWCHIFVTNSLCFELVLENGSVVRRECMVKKTDTLGNKACQTYGTLSHSSDGDNGFNYYPLNF